MEVVAVCVFVWLLYIVLRLLSAFSAWMTGAGLRYRAYQRLAAARGGRYESRGLSDPPTVSFLHRGAAVRVGLAPNAPGLQPQPPRTRVVARFIESIPFRLELAPTGRAAPLQPPRGTRLAMIGEPKFDRDFIVHVNDVEMARDFLGPAARASIRALQRLVHPGGMLISVNPERLLVQIDRNLGQNAEALDMAVREALSLHDALRDGVARRVGQGVEVVDAPGDARDDLGPAFCKVCGGPIVDGEIIRCSSCDTPHHRDCWEYVGACSIYGCGGKVGVAETAEGPSPS